MFANAHTATVRISASSSVVALLTASSESLSRKTPRFCTSVSRRFSLGFADRAAQFGGRSATANRGERLCRRLAEFLVGKQLAERGRDFRPAANLKLAHDKLLDRLCAVAGKCSSQRFSKPLAGIVRQPASTNGQRVNRVPRLPIVALPRLHEQFNQPASLRPRRRSLAHRAPCSPHRDRFC